MLTESDREEATKEDFSVEESYDDDDEVEEGWDGDGNWTGEGEELDEDVKDENSAYIEFLHEEVSRRSCGAGTFWA